METTDVQELPEPMKVCRLCYVAKPKLVNLFSNIMYYGDDKETRFDKLNCIIVQLTKLQVNNNDQLPQGVCLQCVSDLFRAKNFVDKCIQTDKLLRNENKKGELAKQFLDSKAEVKDEENYGAYDAIVDIKDSIGPLDEVPFTFSSTGDTLIANDISIVKIEPSAKTVDRQISDCDSLDGSNGFDLANDMIMSLPDMETESSPQLEKLTEVKGKTKVKIKKKKKRISKSNSPKLHHVNFGAKNNVKDHFIEKSKHDKVENSEQNDRKHQDNKSMFAKQTFVCVTCGASLSSKQNLKVHQATHLDDRPFSCDQCDLKFKLKSHLNGHKRNVHFGEKNHFCSECGKGFFSIAQFKFHMMTHTKEYPHVCVHCGKRFAQRGNLKDHIKTHTGIRDVKCPYCPYVTTSTNCLNSHIKGIHKNNKPMQCSECGLRFLYPSGLKRHLTIHTGVKEFQCNHCEKRFRTAEAYKEHIRIHTKEKPYKCRYCDKQCRTYNHRLVHERVHTGNRPYVCQVCKKGFTTNGNLKTHMKTHDKTFE